MALKQSVAAVCRYIPIRAFRDVGRAEKRETQIRLTRKTATATTHASQKKNEISIMAFKIHPLFRTGFIFDHLAWDPHLDNVTRRHGRDGQYQKFEPNTQYLRKALFNSQYQYLWMSLNNTNTQYQYQQKTQYPIPIPNTLLNNTACF